MLVLSRKPSERIHIGDNIIITVVRVSGQTVRIGIDAPKEIRIMREELLDGKTNEARVPVRDVQCSA